MKRLRPPQKTLEAAGGAHCYRRTRRTQREPRRTSHTLTATHALFTHYTLINYDLNTSLLTMMITGCVVEMRTRPEEGTEEERDRSTASCDELQRERSST